MKRSCKGGGIMLQEMKVGELIKYVDERNEDSSISEFYGINIKKEFMPTVANTDNVDSTKYKIVRKNRFVFSGMQTGRDKTIRISLYDKAYPVIVSPAYTTFEIRNTNLILPEYFFMQFLSNESDRFGWFISDSSVRANLDLNRFEEINIKIPPIDVQKKFVKLYRAVSRVPDLKEQIQDICPVLVNGAIKEADDNA